MTQTGDFVIETQGLSKSFGEVQALRGVDLNVPRHSIFGFLGPNGAGKTTLMKILLGLSRPTSGSGTIFGHDIVHRKRRYPGTHWLPAPAAPFHRVHDRP